MDSYFVSPHLRIWVFAAVMASTMLAVGAVHAEPPLQPDSRLLVAGHFLGKDGEFNISGIACFPPAAQQSERNCVVIDDETDRPQFVRLTDGSFTAGDGLPAIQKTAPAGGRFGTPPPEQCHKVDDFADLDGEAVASSGNSVYVTGSQGCSRSKNKMRPSAFLLVRYDFDDQGQLLKVQDTYRLPEALRTTLQNSQAPATAGQYFAKKLEGGARGLNVEGLAVIGNRLLAGLRAPSLDGESFIIEVLADALFVAAGEAPALTAVIHPLKLGAENGIRDLTPLPDGRLLLLAGPTDGSAAASRVPASVWVVDKALSSARKINDLAAAEDGGKAEGLMVMGQQKQLTRILVLYDSLPGGGPRSFLIDLE